MDVAIINVDYMPTCLAGTGQLLITSILVKTWSCFRKKKHNRCILHTERNNMIPKKEREKNAPTLLSLDGQKSLTRSCAKVWQDSVCSIVPLCVAKHCGKV